MRRSMRGFTLIELLVVVAIIALLISILLPSLSRARELAKRAVCASNMKGIGTAMVIYSNDNQEWYPHHFYFPTYNTPNAAPSTHGIGYIGRMGSSNSGPPIRLPTSATTSSTAGHPSRSLFLLVIAGQSTPGQFICPSTGDVEDDLRNRGTDASSGTESAAQPGINRFDFRGYPFLSYGYQMPYSRRGKPRNTLDVRMPYAADKGPFFQAASTLAGSQTTPDEAITGDQSPTTDIGNTPELVVKASAERWRNYNSQNHNGEGQNVLFIDSHAEFLRKPIVGVQNDNIYTYQDSFTDPMRTLLGVDPGNNGTAGSLTNTDTVIIP